MDKKALLKKYGITEKQVALIRKVAEHPIYGALAPEFSRVLPAALRYGVIEQVWLDRSPPITRVVTDVIPGTSFKGTNNQWYEVSSRAITFMHEYDPSWQYTRPSAKWATA
ncbi:restriction endonuclease [Novimethylophilus kurashikiensis]|uniref:Restriction endonuclease n=1 Tax=Novimethylophilus kurashikiensis TaxID=1825523 RepID=A0A2R5FC70_9PROT|nr:hypothetical protein [Novimethylophilus kurashikiensis]GBG14301.1 restriction endonuclease [Novimethylophilus kurashikiensis]